MKRLAMGLAIAGAMLAAACTALTGVRDGPVGGVIGAIEEPAIFGLERAIAGEFDQASAQLAALEAEGSPPSSAQAAEWSARATRAYSRVMIGRIAYDVTLGATASPATLALRDQLRAATDRAYEGLQRRLAAHIAPPI